jgi:hypothetical protein
MTSSSQAPDRWAWPASHVRSEAELERLCKGDDTIVPRVQVGCRQLEALKGIPQPLEYSFYLGHIGPKALYVGIQLRNPTVIGYGSPR